MAKSRAAEVVTSGTGTGTARESDLRDAIAADLFVQLAPAAESRGKTIDSVAARAFEMADIFLRARDARSPVTAPSTPPTE